jgi:hypothetical protein
MSVPGLIDAKLLPLLRTVAADSVRDAALFRFDKRDPQQLTAICVYSSILELSQGQLALIESGQTTALPVVLRSLLEAYADLRALLEDPEYHKRMYASFLDEKIRFLRNVSRSTANPFLFGVSQGMDVAAEISNLEEEIEPFRKEGRGPLKTHERFSSGKLQHEYQSIYWLLCLEGHNNMSALDDRHIEKEGDDYHVVLFRAADPADLVRALDALATVLIDGATSIHGMFGTEARQRYQAHRRTFDAIRAEYPKA